MVKVGYDGKMPFKFCRRFMDKRHEDEARRKSSTSAASVAQIIRAVPAGFDFQNSRSPLLTCSSHRVAIYWSHVDLEREGLMSDGWWHHSAARVQNLARSVQISR